MNFIFFLMNVFSFYTGDISMLEGSEDAPQYVQNPKNENFIMSVDDRLSIIDEIKSTKILTHTYASISTSSFPS